VRDVIPFGHHLGERVAILLDAEEPLAADADWLGHYLS